MRPRARRRAPWKGSRSPSRTRSEIAGKRTTFGSLLYQDWVGSRNEPIVERLIEAGAIIHARTVTPEFSIAFWTHSRLWGVTRNPWNPDFDVGGSSGGSAAALAAGFTPLATGSDIGGSVRVPRPAAASWATSGRTGGYRSRRRTTSITGRTSARSHALSRIARCMTDVFSGPHPRDHTSLPATAPLGIPEGEVRGLRLAVSYDLGDWPVSDAVRAAVAGAVDALRDAGATVEEIGPGRRARARAHRRRCPSRADLRPRLRAGGRRALGRRLRRTPDPGSPRSRTRRIR